MFPFVYSMNVNNRIDLRRYKNDTLYLDLLNQMRLPTKQLGILNLSVTTKGKKLSFHFDRKRLSIPLPRNTKQIDISYQVTGQNLFLFNEDNFSISETYEQRAVSWYFISDNMKFNEVVVNIPDGTTLLTNTECARNNNSYKLDTAEINKSNQIDMVIFNNRFYTSFSNTINNVTYNLYLHNFEELGIDSTLLNSPKSPYVQAFFPKKIIDKCKLEQNFYATNKQVEKAMSFFPPTDKRIKFDILSYYWGGKDFGNGWVTGKLMQIDTSFVANRPFIHECIHIFDPLGDYYQTADSAKIFFSESMIDFLADYIYLDGDLSKKDNRAIRMINYTKKSPDFTSIFQVKENNPKSQPIIYARTPFIIREYALLIGVDKFIKSLKEFYEQSYKKKQVEINDFKAILLKNTNNDKYVNDFFESL